MVKEIAQNRKQGNRIETLMKQQELSTEVIARKLSLAPRVLNKIIWGEMRLSMAQEGLALMLGFNSWKKLSAFVEDDEKWVG